MNIQKRRGGLADDVSRRQWATGIVMALGSLAVGPNALGGSQEPMVEAPAKKENQARTSIHQEVAFNAGAKRIYEALLDSRLFAAFTGRPADIDRSAGGAFTLFGGLVSGRNIELVANQLIVQAWRPESWDHGIYSVVRFELRPRDLGSLVVFDHTGFPEGKYDGLLAGWEGHYWGPLARYLT
jgi:activator of HSP90 ATPase